MDQVFVQDFVTAREEDLDDLWRPGDAWLAGGTVLFAAVHPHVSRLVDLSRLGWSQVDVSDAGLTIGATCTLSDLRHTSVPAEWTSGSFIRDAVDCLLGGFKVWNRATVGGNICASLPASPMLTMTCALRANFDLWSPGGGRRTVAAPDFATGDNTNVLTPGELLRSVHIPIGGLMRRLAHRRFALTAHGRSSVFLVGTTDGSDFELTITAATAHPVRLSFEESPSSAELETAIDSTIPDSGWFDDPNGTPEHRRHLTHAYAQQLRVELA